MFLVVYEIEHGETSGLTILTTTTSPQNTEIADDGGLTILTPSVRIVI